jgi:hypothetical protein
MLRNIVYLQGTNSIHFEMVPNLTSETLIASLKRLIVRRVLIDYLCSDKDRISLGAIRGL